MARRMVRAKSFGPTGIVGPSNRLRGGTKAQWATQSDISLSSYTGDHFGNFLPCGTKFFFMFLGNLVACGASDQFTQIDAR